VGLIQAGLLLGLVMGSVAVCTWMERKVSARIQDRLGPTRTGGRFGWLQAPADGLKLLCKEDLVPAGADGLLYRLAPYISFCASFTPYFALPFADGWVAVQMDIALFFILAVLGLEVFGVILGGYASGSKWSLFGSMREAAQVISYEIPLGMCCVVPVLIAGTMDLTAIANDQAGWFTNWYMFHDPFTFCTFWIYVVCATAGTNRAPFDLPEAESELVAGFMTEYSGFRWSMFFMGEYSSMLLLSMVGAILFAGGWNGPIPVVEWTGRLAAGMVSASGWTPHPVFASLAGFVGNCFACANLILKGYIGVTFMMWLRWTLPRLRIDQVMTTCLKYCVPLVSIMLAGVMIWTFAFPNGLILKRVRSESPRVSRMESGEDCKLQIASCKLQIEQAASGNLQFAIYNLQFAIPSLPEGAHQR
jgi:NADH-quinone oxidoreductase subunit H